MDTSKYISDGQKLGYEAEQLREYVAKCEQQYLEREERARVREDERKRQELEVLRLNHELEMEKQELDRKFQREEQQRALEKEHMEIEKMKLQVQLGEQKTKFSASTSGETKVKAPRPKLPAFDENKDDMDAFLDRFERFASSQQWPRESWSVSLSPLLTGKGLQAYSSMPAQEANNYDNFKVALLKRYMLTEEGFRVKFRNCKPDSGETVFQFVARMKRYYQRWKELSEVEDTVESLDDLIIREQFMSTCSNELSVFLKERKPRTVDEMTRLAEQYLEAHSGAPVKGKNNFRHPNKAVVVNSSKQSEPGKSDMKTVEKDQCRLCFRRGHFAKECPMSDKCFLCHKHGHIAKNCPQSTKKSVASGCSNSVTSKNMPVISGFVGKKRVSVLRDTGCSGVAVRASLVEKGHFTGGEHSCVLIDGTVRQFPVANVHIDTPYYVGLVEAMVMEKPVYDVVLGNIPGVSNIPDPEWRQEVEIGAVTTRAQAKKEKLDIRPLKVALPGIQEVNSNELIAAQKADSSLEKCYQLASSGELKQTKGQGSYGFVVKNDILYKCYKNSDKEVLQVVVPKPYREEVMKLAHESIVGGHLGVKKTSDRITSAFYWPGHISDISRYCKSCDVCQRTTPRGKVTKVPMGEMPLIDVPFHRIAVDLIGPIAPVTERGNRYILTVVDYATRYPEAIALPRIETERVAEALLEVFCRIGFPKEVLSDCGTQFTSDLMKEVSRLISMKQLFTTPYNPKCNGLCERMNGVLKSMIKKMCQERPKDWDRYLPAVLFAYREVPQASLGFSPFELLYGRTVRGPMEILKELWTESTTPEVQNTYQYIIDLRNRLEDTCKLARESLRAAQGISKHHYDKKARDRTFKKGEKVLLLLPTDHNKLTLQWKGPFEVAEVVNKWDCRVSVNGKMKTYHVNLLKKYLERDTPIQEMEQVNMAVIEPDLHDEGVIDDENLLELEWQSKPESYHDVKINEELSEDKKSDLRKLVEEYQSIFTEKPGSTSLEEHSVTLVSKEPIRVKQYSLPYATRTIVHDEVKTMLDNDIIEPSNSPYNSPIVIVRKKDGSSRFCVDFRRLNAVTCFDTEPMGNAEDIIARLSDDVYYSKVDLSKGYWQIPMSEESKPLTSFSTSEGSYQFKRMPFGMVNSGATFNKMMRKLLNGAQNLDHYVDDVLCHTTTWAEHLKTLRELFQRVRDAGLTIRPSKCWLGYQTVNFVGHQIGEGKVAMETEKVDRLRNAPRPQTKKQVRSFIGLAGYYRKFIPNFSELSAPLTDLTKKGEPTVVRWEEPQECAFQTLRKLLISAPILRMPDFSRSFILRTDASDVGVGAVLLQKYDDELFPVAYASKKLLPREKNYSVIERECLAVVFGVKKFQNYLYGKEFTVQTDHEPLTYLQKSKTENGRLMRWALYLQSYRFRVEAIKGSDNVGADYLSRLC
ncbi:uncharacterized protein LOC106153310 [Lingula anatina]|uniref:Uncharacterized protein LOC106153310 n=1 Tax=Lingula anatina TaxID=7574 RepID=A0A1S3H977_LINAN|nr:uncharacterized protein LOC106153310 [Lingula anatina]|eukprot:XP_013382645.1 uncharacterized protein LOC106153310 [Lingula anatina]